MVLYEFLSVTFLFKIMFVRYIDIFAFISSIFILMGIYSSIT